MNYYMADTPGRLRIESPCLKGETSEAAKFHDYIMAIPGVSSVDMKPVIGSATIHYDANRLDQVGVLREHHGDVKKISPGVMDEVGR